MHNLREITTNLDGEYYDWEPEEWPENVAVAILLNITFETREAGGLLMAFEDLMTAASQANTRIEKLSMYWMWRDIVKRESEVFWDTPLFQNLTSLSAYFHTCKSHAEYRAMEKDQNEGRIFKFLSSAPKLRLLALGLEPLPRKYVNGNLELPQYRSDLSWDGSEDDLEESPSKDDQSGDESEDNLEDESLPEEENEANTN
ncbi:hypothetical protein RUND412_008919 [Rhizina undulata]